MGLAGVKGVIVDWYGITGGGLSDELAASDAVIAQTSAAGMLWSLCYEDRTIREGSASAQAAQLEADWVYIRDRYINTHAGVGGARKRGLLRAGKPAGLSPRRRDGLPALQ